MKKTLFILLFAMFTSCAVGLQAQEMDWGRVNIGADFSFQPTVFQFRSGLLSQHPERSIHLNAGYRLWRKWEVCLYAYLVGAKTMSGGVESFGGGRHVSYLYVENGYEVGYGMFVQWHVRPYEELTYWKSDIAFRLGVDLGGPEADTFWGGMICIYHINRHLSLTLAADYGTFQYGRMNNFISGTKVGNLRSTIGFTVDL